MTTPENKEKPPLFTPAMRRRIGSAVTLFILVAVLWRVMDRLFIVIWAAVPWWGLLLIGVLLFLAVDYLVSKVIE